MKSIFTLLLLFSLESAFSQSFTWDAAKNISCCSSVNGFAFDKAGNMYVAGTFYGDDYVGAYYITSTTPFKYNSFIAKTNKNGVVQWVKIIGSNESSTVQRIATDAIGNIFLTGFYQVDLVYDGSSLPCTGQNDAFIMKINSAGTLQWWDHTIGTGSEFFYDVAVNPAGDAYVTGKFAGSMNVQGSYYFASPGSVYDMCVIKYNGITGAFAWARQTNSQFGGNSSGSRITVDGLGNTYVLGNFGEGYTTFGDYTIFGSFNDYFVSRFDEASNFIYTSDVGDIPNGYICNIDADAAGNIYLAGNFGGFSPYTATISGTTITSPGNSEIFIAKYNADYVMQWLHTGGGATTGDFANDLAVANDGDTYVAFTSGATVTFGSVSATAANPGANEIAVVKYNGSGTAQWASISGGKNYDAVSCLDISQNKKWVGISGIGGAQMYFGAKKVAKSNLYVARLSDTQLRVVNEEQQEMTVSIYPNPATDHITISGIAENNLVEIFDLHAKKIRSQHSVSGSLEIKTADLPAGVYLVAITGNGERLVRKLIIQ
ncbi:MAG: T9SS type A sorting domain-containing protein [Chitinophagaceae bacterium]|nr:T9SS type A sorting domain-containing protein [Chitinophagaceae bacterium]